MPKFFDCRNLPDVFRGSEARKAGLITESQLRGPGVRRLFQDVYAPAHVPVTHKLRCKGAALLAPKEAVLTGRSAATLRGVELAGPDDPVEFVVPERYRFGPIVGIKVRRTEVEPYESLPWHGVRIAKPYRIALDLLLRLSPRKFDWVGRLRIGVPDLDKFLRAENLNELVLKRQFNSRRNRGIRLARHALRLADPRASSRPESELRIVLGAGGIHARPQHKVWSSQPRRFLGRIGLAAVEIKVGIEYEDRWRDTAGQRRHRRRRRRMEAEGWRFIIADADDLANGFARVVSAVRKAARPPRLLRAG